MNLPAAHEPYGMWRSPLSAKSLSLSQRLSDAQWDTDGATLVWLEGHGDKGVLVASRLDGEASRDLTEDLSVRARVGYGGGDFTVSHGAVFFASGGRLYRKSISGGAPKPITPAFGQASAPAVSPCGRFVLYVFNFEHRDGLAVVDANGTHWPRKVAEGRDFFMQPRWSSDGKRAAWVAWDHPNMPWDGAELILADVRVAHDGLPVFEEPTLIAGGDDIAVMQPEFSPDGRYLSYLSDQSGWFDLYLFDLKTKSERKLIEANGTQLGAPAWAQGQRNYGWANDSKGLVFTRNNKGFTSLYYFDIESDKSRVIIDSAEYSDIQLPAINPAAQVVSAIVSSGTLTSRVIAKKFSVNSDSPALIVKRASGENIDPTTLIAPKAVSWRGVDGVEIHGLLYSSKRDVVPGLPPAIIHVHGGPTAQSRALYSAEIQFLATRGYTVLSVNYRGSTGYGRAYMNALRTNWGIHDVNDSISAAEFLGANGLADPSKIVIMGGSAGGFTVLQALVVHPGVFKAGVCLFGVSNQFALAMETHKFEERYTDSLIGPLPQASALYIERSPAFHAHKIVDPMIVFQGEVDEVVPKNQSDVIVESLKSRGIPHEYHVYAGEGHGWRKTETIEAYVTSLEKFLKRYVLFA